jgi:beta-phosphoglucomutase
VSALIGCIFDFDGVIVDSEPAHAAAKRVALGRFGIAVSDDVLVAWKGRTDVDFIDHVVAELAPPGTDAAALLAAKRVAYLQAFVGVPLVDGIKPFLAVARRRFARMGIATSATRNDFELIARRHDLARWFDAIVTGDDTDLHKPNPEPYLLALERLGLRADEAMAIEDSPNGVRSAKAAGLLVTGLVGAFDRATLLDAGADRVVSSFADLAAVLDNLAADPGSPAAP